MTRQKGFTLLEILVAFAILALLGSALLQLFQRSTRNLDQAGNHTYAVLLAQGKINEVDAFGRFELGKTQGEFDTDYHWQLDIKPFRAKDLPTENDKTQLVELTLTVFWGSEAKPHSYTLNTLRLLVAENTDGEQVVTQ